MISELVPAQMYQFIFYYFYLIYTRSSKIICFKFEFTSLILSEFYTSTQPI